MADQSRILACPPHRWHVVEAGTGPLLILIHGAGGAVQSWRHLMPRLARDHRVVAFDLPGQGFTRLGAANRCGLDAMAEDIARLMDDQGWQPAAIIGHSAGGALALRLAEMRPIPEVIGLNAAVSGFSGLAGVLFPIMAKALAALPFVASMFTASTTRPGSVERLIAGTGSNIPPDDLRFYRRLVSDRDHVNGTLSMMAQWRLDPLLARLPHLKTPVAFITGDRDRTVPPRVSADLAGRMPQARHVNLPGLGHLAHEEDADRVETAIRAALDP